MKKYFWASLTCLMLKSVLVANVYFVTNNSESGAGSLREAINFANANATATAQSPHIIDATAVHDTISLDSIIQPIKTHVIFYGPQSGSPLVINGKNIFSIFVSLPMPIYIEINNIHFINARNSFTSGAACYIDAGVTAKIRYCNFKNCYTGIHGGAIYNDGILNIQNCHFENDTSGSTGSGIANNGMMYANKISASNNYSFGGGAISNFAMAVIDSSLFVDNYTPSLAGAIYSSAAFTKTMNSTFIHNGGGFVGAYSAALAANDTIINCTFDGNYNIMGAGTVANGNSIMYIENSTFSRNISAYEGGVLWSNDTNSYINHCTFWGNYANGFGGGAIYTDPGTWVTMENSIVTGNNDTVAYGKNIVGEIRGNGHNIYGDTTGTIIFSSPNSFYNSTDTSVIDTILSLNNGFTKTHRIIACGIAVNSANNNAPVKDQRGIIRYGNPDIGSYEIQKVITFSIGDNEDTLCSNANAITLSATPANGIFLGNGVTGNVFNPAAANVGWNMIIYTYTDSDSCTFSQMDSLYIDICTSMKDNFKNEYTISTYPNPTQSSIVVETNYNDFGSFVIRDVLGKIIYQAAIYKKEKVDLTHLDNGIYFIEMDVDQRRVSQKFILNK